MATKSTQADTTPAPENETDEQRAAREAAEKLAAAGTPEKVAPRTYSGFTAGQPAPKTLYRVVNEDDGSAGELVEGDLQPGQRGWHVVSEGQTVTPYIASQAENG